MLVYIYLKIQQKSTFLWLIKIITTKKMAVLVCDIQCDVDCTYFYHI